MPPKANSRLLFELNPMAFLMEQAGGAASNGKMRILDIVPQKIDERAPIFIGCKEDVKKAEDFIAAGGWKETKTREGTKKKIVGFSKGKSLLGGFCLFKVKEVLSFFL